MTVAKVLGKIAMKAVIGAVGGAFMCLGADFVENTIEAEKAAKAVKKAAEMVHEYEEAKEVVNDTVETAEEVVEDFSEVIEDGA